ncbi:YEATS domain-containing protein 2 [Tupaia chinensis]|uniref:YEATS domain-containing protein 2 n=1 Tax=Tupaia chinensis TaxID=246437 RepID=L9L0P1_TUPCH|nr:YEATS domain-containing protein 2 [Tupaia chinensis]
MNGQEGPLVLMLTEGRHSVTVSLLSGPVGKQPDGAASGPSSAGGSVMKTSGQQACVSQATMGTCKAATPTVVSATSLVSSPNPVSGKATVSGLLKIHSSNSSPQQAVLTIPSQLKPLSVSTSGGVQTILMPVNKVIFRQQIACRSAGRCPDAGRPQLYTSSCGERIDHLETIQQLLTAVVKKIPLITAKSDDASCFSAKSVEQYYSWNIGKRRAAETAHGCRCHGYTPPDPESLRSDGDSIEDVLTQIDSEPECPSSLSSADNLCRKLEDLQQFQKREPENEEEVDILNLSEPLKTNIKKEQEEKQEEVKFYLPPTPGSEFIGDVTQKIGIALQPVALDRGVCASVVEDMILKATEQLVSDILRQALAVGYQAAAHNRIPKEITVSNIHQAICSIPFLDFLTNKHMGMPNEDQ